MTTTLLGKTGEDQAAGYLQAKGYDIVGRNYKTKTGEIDLIAKDGEWIAFIEVKKRSSARFGLPEESVTKKKLAKIKKTAYWYIAEKSLEEKKRKIEVVAILDNKIKLILVDKF